MGGGAPSPPPIPPAPVIQDVANKPLTEDRLRRQRASGRQGNIISSLADQVTDTQSGSKISKLLG